MFCLCLHGFFPGTPTDQNMQLRSIGESKLPVGVNMNASGCLSTYVSPMTGDLSRCTPPLTLVQMRLASASPGRSRR